MSFTENFAGHIFVDAKGTFTLFYNAVLSSCLGTEYQAMVEYAPYQRLPNPMQASDEPAGTLESDQEFLQFVESLKTEIGSLPSAEIQLEQRLAMEKELLGTATASSRPFDIFFVNRQTWWQKASHHVASPARDA